MSDSTITSSFLDSVSSSYVDSTETTSDTDSDELLMDDFLKIFLTQLQYQDPLNPMEGTDITAQIAQMTMVEQQYNTNEILEKVSEQLTGQAGTHLMSYMGKEVLVSGNALYVEEGNVQNGVYYLEEAADVEIVIYDTDGNEINRLYPGELEAGEHEVEWDGTDSTGAVADDGFYVYDILALNSSGNSITVDTTFKGLVTGITYENEDPYLIVGDAIIDPDDVLRIYE